MNRSFAAPGLALMLAATTAGAAAVPQSGPPPLSVKVLLVSDPDLDAASRAHHHAVLQTLAADSPSSGWFRFQESGLDPADFLPCINAEPDRRACVNPLLTEKRASGPTVVVLAHGGGSEARWQCVGIGPRATSPERQSVQLDLTVGQDPLSPRGFAARVVAAGCITAAGAESGW